MTKEEIRGFTNRITASNSTGLIAILYDIYEAYENDAKEAFKEDNLTDAVAAIKKCSDVIHHLKEDLNFKYEISKQLYGLYDFCQMQLSKSIYTRSEEGLLEAGKIMSELSQAFKEIASKDQSKPIMKNVEKVMVGMTYSKGSLNESVAGNSSRGFFV